MEVEFPGEQKDGSPDGSDARKATRAALGCLEQTFDGFDESINQWLWRPEWRRPASG